MPDRERTDVDPAVFDFESFTAEARHAFKPHFADVVQRAGRRRGAARAAGAAIVAVGVAAGGGTTLALSGAGGPGPTPSASPWATHPPVSGSSRTPAPQPSYTEVAPGSYDVTEPDVPLTGLWTELQAGDLDHLYLEYQDCEGDNCTRMIAASADRGRTWRKLRMPAGLATDPKSRSMVAVHGKALVARDARDRQSRYSPATYWTSTDGGVTWRQPKVRDVDALPVGWPLLEEWDALAAFDPATGNIARITSELDDMRPNPDGTFTGTRKGPDAAPPLRVPTSAGIWRTAIERTPIPSPRPTGFQPDSWVVVMVSRDGGRTWEKHRIPEVLYKREGGGISPGGMHLTTADGETLYAIEERGDSVQLHVSTDGAATWRTGALVDLDGPLLSLLPTADGAVIIESATDTFRSTDQAQTFTRVGPSLGARAYPVPGGGYAIPTNNNEVSLWLSPDGANWTYVPRPDVP
ncbi:hypothetical protein ACFP2T_03980 [Plantactinospora solaniradicis]|uniref:Exo-alpha-sialidase n=1 Tax=Plantactinospora solaniradicis TaxID=1723736 RepID=A0ABW1K0U3_9ACTN